MPFPKTHLELPRLGRERSEVQKALKQRVEAALKKQAAAEEIRAKALTALSKYYRSERDDILGRAAKKLDALRMKERKTREAYGTWTRQQRLAKRVEIVRYAQELGVNTDRLFHLNAYVKNRAALLLGSVGRKKLFPTDFHTLDHEVSHLRFKPPYLGTFDVGYYHITGDGELKELQSFFDPSAAISGGGARIRNWSADNDDTGLAYQDNGYLGCYVTGPTPGPIVITATVEFVDGELFIQTDTEFGFAASTIAVDVSLSFAAYLHEVGDLGSIEHGQLAFQVYQGDGDWDENEYSGPPMIPLPAPGAVKAGAMMLPTVVPPNTTLGIYVGTRHRVYYYVNDVSVNARSAGRWIIKEFTVAQIPI
jgi:hypothetical protein